MHNLGFQALPFLFAIISLPLLNKHWPLQSIGQLSLVWVLMNYFQFFDFGLGRALTTRISHLLSSGDEKQSKILAGLGLQISLGLSSIFIGISYLLVQCFWPEISTAFICGLVPILLMTNLLRGVLEGHQRFFLVNVLNTLLASSNFLIPAVTAQQGGHLAESLQHLFFFRLSCLIIWFFLGKNFFQFQSYDPQLARDLVRFGGWISIANLVGPLMTSFDRFALNTSEFKADLAFYSTPQEFVARLWVIPQAVCRSLVTVF
jgi:O-antigen/teichoic acid export membrane protein